MSVFSTFRRCFSSTSIHSTLVFRSIGRSMESESKRSDLFVPNRKMLFHQKKVQWSDKKIMFLDVFVPNGWDINDVIQSPEKYVCVCVFPARDLPFLSQETRNNSNVLSLNLQDFPKKDYIDVQLFKARRVGAWSSEIKTRMIFLVKQKSVLLESLLANPVGGKTTFQEWEV